MNRPLVLGVGGLLVILLLAFSTTYTVKYSEIAIRTRFGQVNDGSVVLEPGLHMRLPVFIDKVHKLDKRLQLVESPQEEIITADGLQLVVRCFLLWQVDADESGTGALNFFRRYGSIEGAESSIEGHFRTASLGAIGRYNFDDLIGAQSRLAEVEESIRSALAGVLAESGIVPSAVGVSQVLLPPRTSRAVLERMKATRDVLAKAENAKGTAEASRIRAEANTAAEKIRAFAAQRAEEIRAEGELQSARYLEQMNEDPELATFLVWLDTLRQALSDRTTFVMPTSEVPWHLLRSPAESGGVPQPQEQRP